MPDVIPAAQVLNAAITIVSQIGGKITTEVKQNIPLNNRRENVHVPPDAVRVSWQISGVWFSHTRIYGLFEKLSPVATGRGMANNANTEGGVRASNRKEVQKSWLTATRYPLVISFDVLSYKPRLQPAIGSGELANLSIASKEEVNILNRRKEGIEKEISRYDSELDRVYANIRVLKEGDERIPTLEKREKRLLRLRREERKRLEKILRRIKRSDKHYLEKADISRKLNRADMAYEGRQEHHIENFRVRPEESVESVKSMISSGISVDARIDINATPGAPISMVLLWQERALASVVTHTGEIRIGLEGNTPTVTGSGKFYQRFMATMTGPENVR
ncbi:hypothetical protein [Streptomyces sp. NPDC047981]|uniref:hypothetical protein n=1 Tax=Streptomyces sp. NPDC047981 TaxID=3154610 RepID=UPI0034171958